MFGLRLGGALPLAVAVLAVAGCGVEADRFPRNIPAQEVPFDLLTPTSSTVVSVPRETSAAQIFLLSNGRLVTVPRQVAAPSTVGTVMASLVQGPTPEEADRGLTSAVDRETRVLSVEIVNGTAVINLSEAFSRIGVRDQISALAQVVFTATALPDVNRVQVLLDGAAVLVPRADGTSTDAPLRRSDYPGFAPAGA